MVNLFRTPTDKYIVRESRIRRPRSTHPDPVDPSKPGPPAQKPTPTLPAQSPLSLRFSSSFPPLLLSSPSSFSLFLPSSPICPSTSTLFTSPLLLILFFFLRLHLFTHILSPSSSHPTTHTSRRLRYLLGSHSPPPPALFIHRPPPLLPQIRVSIVLRSPPLPRGDSRSFLSSSHSQRRRRGSLGVELCGWWFAFWCCGTVGLFLFVMAIVKNSSFRDSRFEDGGGCSPSVSGGSFPMSSDGEEEEDVRMESTSAGSNCSDMSEVDSGMESDDCDYLELGEAGSEYCQVGRQSCMIPYELYDLPDLASVLSVDVWNNCLTEEERFSLAEYLPDMDQETFMRTMKELFSGDNLHFGSPLLEFFNMLKGGLCEPRVVLYRQGLNFLLRREHYHRIRKYQNSMVGSLVRIRDVWENLDGYGIEEKLQFLTLSTNQRALKYNDDGDVGSETDSEDKEDGELFWRKRLKMAYRTADPSKTSFDAFQRSHAHLESAKFEKGKPKGMLKMAPSKALSKKGYIGPTGNIHPSTVHSLGFKKGRALTPVAAAPHEYHTRYEYGAEERTRNRLNDYIDDMDEQGYERVVQHGTRLKPGKRQKFVKRGEQESSVGFSGRETPSYHVLQAAGGKKKASQLVSIASYDARANNQSRRLERDWSDSADGDWVDYQPVNQHSRHAKNTKDRKWEMGEEVNVKSQKAVPVQWNNLRFHADDYMSRDASVSNRRRSSQGHEIDMEYRHHSSYTPNEETESDSSEYLQEEEEVTPFPRKQRYTNSILENSQHANVRSLYDPKKPKKLVKHTFDGARLSHMSGKDLLQTKGKHSSKAGLTTETLSPSGNLTEDQKQTYKVIKKGKMQRNPVQGHPPSRKISLTAKKNKRYNSDILHHPDHVGDYPTGVLGKKGNMNGASEVMDILAQEYTSSNRDQVAEAHVVEPDSRGHLNMPLSWCKSVTKKKKSKEDGKTLDGPDEPEYMQTSPDKPANEIVPMKKKGKRKADSVIGTLSMLNNGTVTPEKEIAEAEPEMRPARKPFTLITPTVHTGFSFSIVHLLSAVRKAMVTVIAEDACEVGSRSREENGVNGCHSLENLAASISEERKNMPSLTVQEIVNRVRSNPGDPCILETQEPLQDLIRGVLKIISSKTAPLGAKGWKALVVYEKSTKSWSWTGPVSPTSADPVEEETSAEAWNIPHKMLVKLVDAFANWLKSGQETLKQIGSLPPPPIMVLPNLDEKERFRDLRAQKSLITISPSSDEVKAYFRKEEFLRYQVPDRAFSYTAADGKKSIVAPLRRGGGKPTSKARDHFMLKPDRPPHVTILCLVRDAAARLPGSIGTRADVCALIRDSQYIMEDVSDAQVNQVVSGALDRLHYERDPCVQYDNERKLWVYLHREREEEDFEDDGTSSTKKWKKPRKDTTENSDVGAAETNCNGDDNQLASVSAGFDFTSGPNMDSSSIQAGEKPELLYHDLRPNIEIVEPFIDSMQGTAQGNPMAWDVLGLNPLQENRIVCQENSTNEDFDDEAIGRERPVGLLNASLL